MPAKAIRLVLAAGAAHSAEVSHQVLIDELERKDGAAAQGVDICLRYLVPVFLTPPQAPGAAAPRADALEYIPRQFRRLDILSATN